MARKSEIDIRYAGGTEPTITKDSSNTDLILAYNYYNYYYDAEDAKSFVISFLKSRKVSKQQLKRAQQLRAIDVKNIGWNCRIMANGGTLPEEIRKSTMSKLQNLIDAVVEEKKTTEPNKVVVNIQERIANKAKELIGDLEEQIDIFILEKKNDFNATNWFEANSIKPAIAKFITDYYQPLHDEIYDAIEGKDPDLKEAYKSWKKTHLKKYLEFIKSILSASQVSSVKVVKSRKPRKKKEKPAALIVAKMKYQEKDEEYNLTSINPAEIVGAQQLWVFNTKNRALSVYNALGRSGLTVKGTTIVGFDEKTSTTKKLRKPAAVLPNVLTGGKIVLRKLMGDLKTVETAATGRINTTTILMRTIK